MGGLTVSKAKRGFDDKQAVSGNEAKKVDQSALILVMLCFGATWIFVPFEMYL